MKLYISGLNIPCRGKSVPLSSKNRAELSNKHLKVDFIIIHEILMVSSKLLYLMHKPLNEIFSPSPNICYSGQKEICISQLQRTPGQFLC